MGKFKFRLQSFLGLKKKMEEQKELEYGKAMQKLEEQKSKQRQLEEELNQSVVSYRAQLTDRISPMEIKEYSDYINVLKQRMMIQEKIVADHAFVVDQTRKDLATAVKERKMLEKLKEKDQVAFNKEMLLEEQKFVDEIVSYQYNQREKN